MTQPTFKITRLVLTPTRHYHPQFRHPFLFHVSKDGIANLSEIAKGQDTISPLTLSAIINELVVLKTEPDPVTLPNGWNTPRFSFLMEIEIQHVSPFTHKLREIVTGYTDRYGLIDGEIDPDMLFIIDSITRLRTYQENTPTGSREVVKSIGTQLVLTTEETDWTKRETSLRPADIFAAMHRVYTDLGGQNVIDTRTLLHHLASFANVDNIIPSEYLAKTLNAFTMAKASPMFDHGDYMSILHTARGYIGERSATQDPFSKGLASVRGETAPTNWFYVSDLLKLIQEEQITAMHVLDVEPPTQPEGDAIDPSSMTARVAYSLAMLTYAMMRKHSIENIHFEYRDPHTSWCNAIQIHAFTSSLGVDVDVNEITSSFAHRMEHEIKHWIQLDQTFPLQVGVIGGITDHIQMTFKLPYFDSKEQVTVTIPTFCLSKLSPLVCKDSTHIVESADNITALFNAVENTSSLGRT